MSLPIHLFNNKPHILLSEATAAGYFTQELWGIDRGHAVKDGRFYFPRELEPGELSFDYTVDDHAISVESWKYILLSFTLNGLSPMTGQPCRKVQRLASPKRSYRTYIIEAQGAGLVKIGKAGNCQARLKQLQTAQACELRLLIDHPRDIEAMLHKQFSEARVKGEWFEYTVEIKQWVSRNQV